MITHIVFFKFRSPADVEPVRAALEGMRGRVPTLRELEVGVDELHTERSFDLSLLTRFDSWVDLDAYRIDPVHLKVIELVKQVGAETKVVDYEK